MSAALAGAPAYVPCDSVSDRTERREEAVRGAVVAALAAYRCASVLAREEHTCIVCQGSGTEALELSVSIGGGPRFERRVVPVGP